MPGGILLARLGAGCKSAQEATLAILTLCLLLLIILAGLPTESLP
jgi:hypothetical protein